jgi:hypothetical protein
MAISKTTLYLLSIVLILTIVMTYFVHHSRQENFEDVPSNTDTSKKPNNQNNAADTYFGILPKDKHPNRITNIIYYNDPIFISYGEDKFVRLVTDKSVLGDMKTALTQIAYLSPTKKINGLTPVSYKEPLYIKVYPNTNFNKKFNVEFEIEPYTTPFNNQQPYLQINDIVSFRTKLGQYFTINPVTSAIELLTSSSLPNNGIFKLTNSPQCYVNYIKYGIDTRKQSVSTLSSIVDRMRKELDKQLETMSKDDDRIRELEKQQVLLKEAIEKAENNKDYVENELSILKQDYESTMAGIKDQNDTTKVDVDKDIANRLQLVENVIDANYLKLMKNVVDKGCS